jgi:Flp pilus assembly protein TadG
MRTEKARPTRWRRLAGEKGAVAVEFAFIAPLLIALLLGVSTYGLAWSRSVAIADAVRGGARFGGTLVTTTPGGWGTTVRDRVVALSAGDGLTSSQVCAGLYKGPGEAPIQTSPCPASLPKPPTPGAIITTLLSTDCLVVVWAARPSQLIGPAEAPDGGLMVGSQSANLNRAAYERYERPC